jgi:TonB family protein
VTRRCFVFALLCAAVLPGYSQVTSLSHFVSPLYPPLARQALVSGQAAFVVNVAKDGSVANISEQSSDQWTKHPLLTQGAKACVQEWKFQPAARERMVTVVVFYAFSGITRESNPVTTVRADFDDSVIRVYVVTDPAPAVHP